MVTSSVDQHLLLILRVFKFNWINLFFLIL